jgi:CheY-like chemotaxis protein
MMTSELTTFTFREQELGTKLHSIVRSQPTGYWKIRFDKDNANLWYLFFSRGRVVFSGHQALSWSVILETLKRYVPHLRSAATNEEIQAIERETNAQTQASMMLLLSKLVVSKKLIDYKEVTKAIQLKILADFDRYLFDRPGEAQFVADEGLSSNRPVVGFEFDELWIAARKRRSQWQQIKAIVPSLESIVSIDPLNIEWLKLNPQQKQQLQQIVGTSKSLQQISHDLGEDCLKAAQTFSKLIQKGLVVLSSEISPEIAQPQPPQATIQSSAPEILVVDDSVVLLKKFKAFATTLGYRVQCCDNALKAVDVMLAANPAVIFLDVNMPQLSGFQLIKQIRLQPKLASIPLVILTAEKSFSNQQRAKWSKSKFLSKPLSADEIKTFESELKNILQEIAPLA